MIPGKFEYQDHWVKFKVTGIKLFSFESFVVV